MFGIVHTSITEESTKTFGESDVTLSQRDTVRADLNMDQVPYHTLLSLNPVH